MAETLTVHTQVSHSCFTRPSITALALTAALGWKGAGQRRELAEFVCGGRGGWGGCGGQVQVHAQDTIGTCEMVRSSAEPMRLCTCCCELLKASLSFDSSWATAGASASCSNCQPTSVLLLLLLHEHAVEPRILMGKGFTVVEA